MSIIQGTGRGGAREFYDYPIEQSLRFDGTSSYLSRTPTTAGNRRTWTWSGWVKLAAIDSGGELFGVETVNGSTYTDIKINNSNKIFLDSYGSTSELQARLYTNAVFRDTSAWYHIVGVLDTSNETASDRAIIYVNGVRQDATISDGFSLSANLMINTANEHRIGAHPLGNEGYLNGYLANIQFIDGQALDASYFGETKDDIWIPKTFDGTSSTGGSTVSTDYGTNGFLLDFSSISGTTINDTAPIDTNHSSANNWTATGF